MTTTRDKLEFALAMGRHTRASLRQVQALMRYAATLQRLAEDDCNVATDERGLAVRNQKRNRVEDAVCKLLDDSGSDPLTDCVYCNGSGEMDSGGVDPQNQGINIRCDCTRVQPVFSGDPRGAVLKIRSNSFGDEKGIVVPASSPERSEGERYEV